MAAAGPSALEKAVQLAQQGQPDDLLKLLREAFQEADSLRRQNSTLMEASTARSKTESDLRGLLSDKDAETVRLRAEINRLRTTLSTTTQLQMTQTKEVEELQAKLQEALALNRAAERKAVMSATSAQDTPRAEIVRLQSELSANHARITELENSLANHAASAAARMAEQQESFVAKIQDMRRVQQEQVAAAEKAAADRVSQMQQELEVAKRQAEEAEQLRQQLKGHESSHADLKKKVQQLEAEQQAAATAKAELQTLRAKCSDLETKCQGLEQQVQQLQERAGSGAPPMDMSMVNMMEGQLARLSEIIRTREAEVLQLKQAVQMGCDERRELVKQIERLSSGQGQQLQAPYSAPASPGPPGSSPGPSVSVPGSRVPSSAGSPTGRRGGHKPHRTGLISRPKFR